MVKRFTNSSLSVGKLNLPALLKHTITALAFYSPSPRISCFCLPLINVNTHSSMASEGGCQ